MFKGKNTERWTIAQTAERKYWEFEWMEGDSEERNLLIKQYWKWYLNLLESFTKINETSKILEIGCGADGIINYIDKGEKYAIDPLMDVYKSKYKMPDDVIFEKGAGESLPFENNYFDVVITTNVLDHTYNPQKVINEIRRVLKNGGILFLTVDCRSLSVKHYRKLKELIGLGDKGHPHSLRAKDVLRLINNSGLEILTSPQLGLGNLGGYTSRKISNWENMNIYKKSLKVLKNWGLWILIDSSVTRGLSLFENVITRKEGDNDYCFITLKRS